MVDDKDKVIYCVIYRPRADKRERVTIEELDHTHYSQRADGYLDIYFDSERYIGGKHLCCLQKYLFDEVFDGDEGTMYSFDEDKDWAVRKLFKELKQQIFSMQEKISQLDDDAQLILDAARQY